MIFKNSQFLDLINYQKNNGYNLWTRIVTQELNLAKIINELHESNLKNRAGSNFVTYISMINRDHPGQKYIICNGDEGEPGTFKDRDIMLYNPHQLIEGIAITGFILGATVGYIYIRGEFIEQISKIEKSLIEAYNARILGKNILNSKFDFDLHMVHGAGSYICGEGTAILESIEGKRGIPRIKPPFATTYGLYGCPTAVINVETLASIPIILAKGAKWYLNLSKSNDGGCKIFSVSGHVNNPGNYEVPLGTSFKQLLHMAGGIKDHKQLKAVLPGGLSSPILPADLMMNLDLDYDSLIKVGSTLGSGIIVMDESTCMVEVLARITKFYMDESCGQCSPCREGTGWLYRIVQRILQGTGTPRDLNVLVDIANNISGKNICSLGDLAVMSVKSFLEYFKDEFLQKITQQSNCNYSLSSSLSGNAVNVIQEIKLDPSPTSSIQNNGIVVASNLPFSGGN